MQRGCSVRTRALTSGGTEPSECAIMSECNFSAASESVSLTKVDLTANAAVRASQSDLPTRVQLLLEPLLLRLFHPRVCRQGVTGSRAIGPQGAAIAMVSWRLTMPFHHGWVCECFADRMICPRGRGKRIWAGGWWVFSSTDEGRGMI